MVLDRPVAFPGTPEEAAANYATHRWTLPAVDDSLECLDCVTKPGQVAASYPCGTEPPRERMVSITTYTASGEPFTYYVLDQPDPDCSVCGEDGHTADECPEAPS